MNRLQLLENFLLSQHCYHKLNFFQQFPFKDLIAQI